MPKTDEKRDPTLVYLAHLVEEWLSAEDGRTLDQLAALASEEYGEQIARPSVSNIRRQAGHVSYGVMKAVTRALGHKPEQLETEAVAWHAEQAKRREEEERVRETMQAQRTSMPGVVKRPGKKSRPNLDAALAAVKIHHGEAVADEIEETLRHIGNVLPADLDLSTWLAIIEDCAA